MEYLQMHRSTNLDDILFNHYFYQLS